MSCKAINWAIEQEIDDPIAQLVLIHLAWHHNDKTGLCCPGQERLAARSRLSVRSVGRKLKQLEDQGLFKRTSHPGKGLGCYSDKYELNFDRQGQPDTVSDSPRQPNTESDWGQYDSVSRQPDFDDRATGLSRQGNPTQSPTNKETVTRKRNKESKQGSSKSAAAIFVERDRQEEYEDEYWEDDTPLDNDGAPIDDPIPSTAAK